MEQPEKRGSLTKLLGRINYYESVLKNPTKDPREARDRLYAELDGVGAFVTGGVTEHDFNKLGEQVRNLPEVNRQRASSMIGDLREKVDRKEIGQGDAIALITDPNTNQTVAIKVPSRK